MVFGDGHVGGGRRVTKPQAEFWGGGWYAERAGGYPYFFIKNPLMNLNRILILFNEKINQFK